MSNLGNSGHIHVLFIENPKFRVLLLERLVPAYAAECPYDAYWVLLPYGEMLVSHLPVLLSIADKICTQLNGTLAFKLRLKTNYVR